MRRRGGGAGARGGAGRVPEEGCVRVAAAAPPLERGVRRPREHAALRDQTSVPDASEQPSDLGGFAGLVALIGANGAWFLPPASLRHCRPCPARVPPRDRGSGNRAVREPGRGGDAVRAAKGAAERCAGSRRVPDGPFAVRSTNSQTAACREQKRNRASLANCV